MSQPEQNVSIPGINYEEFNFDPNAVSSDPEEKPKTDLMLEDSNPNSEPKAHILR